MDSCISSLAVCKYCDEESFLADVMGGNLASLEGDMTRMGDDGRVGVVGSGRIEVAMFPLLSIFSSRSNV